jgi:adenosylcobinamide-GDP ribazoletransferase
VRGPVRPLAAATSFLTAIPVGRRVAFGERDLADGAVLFPAVGALVGLLAATVAWSSSLVLPPFVAGILGVATAVATTAAFHVDGLGDVADAIGASLTGRDPTEVMKDPRLGTFGVAAVSLDLLLKAALLAELVAGERFPWALVGAAAVARVAPILLAWRLPYAGGGTGVWMSGVDGTRVAIAAVSGLVIAVATSGLAAVWMAAAATVVCLALGRWSRVRLGGVTGDVFGAAAELSETLGLLAAVAVASA